jgi:hypothetical protein
MMRRLAIVAAVFSLVTACGQSESAKQPLTGAPLQQLVPQTQGAASPGAPSSAKSPRYKAIKQYLTLEVNRDELEAAWRLAQDECMTAVPNRCEIASSTMSQSVYGGMPRAELQIRIAPELVESYRKKIVGKHILIDDRSESEDKTLAVIDTEAKLKNTAALRDRLRSMLTLPGAKLKELIELEQELARVQSELDSLTAIRQTLARETDKVFVKMEFRSERSFVEPSSFTPISDAIKRAGRILAQSVAFLIEFTVAALPWVFAAIVAFISIRALLRFRRKKKSLSQT